MQKGRLMELLGLNTGRVDVAIPNDFEAEMRQHDISRPDFWFVWSYENQEEPITRMNYGKPVHLGEAFINKLTETKILVNGLQQVTLMDLVETLLAHPEEVKITIK